MAKREGIVVSRKYESFSVVMTEFDVSATRLLAGLEAASATLINTFQPRASDQPLGFSPHNCPCLMQWHLIKPISVVPSPRKS
jgi:hypothetical protein